MVHNLVETASMCKFAWSSNSSFIAQVHNTFCGDCFTPHFILQFIWLVFSVGGI